MKKTLFNFTVSLLATFLFIYTMSCFKVKASISTKFNADYKGLNWEYEYTIDGHHYIKEGVFLD